MYALDWCLNFLMFRISVLQKACAGLPRSSCCWALAGLPYHDLGAHVCTRLVLELVDVSLQFPAEGLRRPSMQELLQKRKNVRYRIGALVSINGQKIYGVLFQIYTRLI